MLRFTQDILLALRAISNEEEAKSMSKTVREQFDFLGVKVIARREATYPIFDKNPPKDGDELALRVTDMWGQPYREIQYAACDYLFRHKHLLGGQHLNFLKHLIKTLKRATVPNGTGDYLAGAYLAARLSHDPAAALTQAMKQLETVIAKSVAGVLQNT